PSFFGEAFPSVVALGKREPFLHRAALAGVKWLTLAARDERRDALTRQLDHQSATGEHGEDLPVGLERTGAEARLEIARHPGPANEPFNQRRVAFIGRRQPSTKLTRSAHCNRGMSALKSRDTCAVSCWQARSGGRVCETAAIRISRARLAAGRAGSAGAARR